MELKIREELDNILLKISTINNLALLLGDYYYTELNNAEYSKGDTLVTIILEKVKDLDNYTLEVYRHIGD